jgi:hypothetical protein
MALPEIHNKPTPKRVAAYLIDTMISHGLPEEFDAMESAFSVQLTPKQRDEVTRHVEAYRDRIRKILDRSM